jgi:hypothetical protein
LQIHKPLKRHKCSRKHKFSHKFTPANDENNFTTITDSQDSRWRTQLSAQVNGTHNHTQEH